jgi:hypothetical protein
MNKLDPKGRRWQEERIHGRASYGKMKAQQTEGPIMTFSDPLDHLSVTLVQVLKYAPAGTKLGHNYVMDTRVSQVHNFQCIENVASASREAHCDGA